jgi:hypothetical protein
VAAWTPKAGVCRPARPDSHVLKSTFNSATDLRADFNNDGVTGIQDFNILKSNFGQAGVPVTCP